MSSAAPRPPSLCAWCHTAIAKDLEAHQRTCTKRKELCVHCHKPFLASELTQHQESACPARMELCAHCLEAFPIRSHANCAKERLYHDGCGEYYVRENVRNAAARVCLHNTTDSIWGVLSFVFPPHPDCFSVPKSPLSCWNGSPREVSVSFRFVVLRLCVLAGGRAHGTMPCCNHRMPPRLRREHCPARH